jgi:hypothetical protein
MFWLRYSHSVSVINLLDIPLHRNVFEQPTGCAPWGKTCDSSVSGSLLFLDKPSLAWTGSGTAVQLLPRWSLLESGRPYFFSHHSQIRDSLVWTTLKFKSEQLACFGAFINKLSKRNWPKLRFLQASAVETRCSFGISYRFLFFKWTFKRIYNAIQTIESRTLWNKLYARETLFGVVSTSELLPWLVYFTIY